MALAVDPREANTPFRVTSNWPFTPPDWFAQPRLVALLKLGQVLSWGSSRNAPTLASRELNCIFYDTGDSAGAPNLDGTRTGRVDLRRVEAIWEALLVAAHPYSLVSEEDMRRKMERLKARGVSVPVFRN